MSTATVRPNERICWMNGAFIPESRALIPFRDRGFLYGDGAFDTTRTFGGRIFRLQEHLERFWRTMRYLRLDPGMSLAAMRDITAAVVDRNAHLLGPGDDWWVSQRITRGERRTGGEPPSHEGPTVIIECTPLPLKERASLFRDGIRVTVPSVRRTPPESLSPRVKSINYLNMIVADHEAHAIDAGSWAVLLDTDGLLAEGLGSNIFLVQDGWLLTPHSRKVLPGISRQVVIELAQQEGIPWREAELDLYDAYNADEVFLTSTSLCLCPVVSVNGAPIGDGRPWKPVTQRLADAYRRLVDHDFVAQYLARLG